MTPQELKASILQLAIQGKLVEQRAEEGSAASLLPTSSVADIADDVPYDIPETWEWCRLEDVATLYNGRAYKKNEMLSSGKYPLLRVGNLFTNNEWYYSDLELGPEKYCEDGDLLYAWSASFGPHIWHGEKVIYHYHIWKLELRFPEMRDYLYWALEAQTERIKKSGHGSTMIHVTKENTEKMLLPLPPLAEQKRIVAKIEELLPYIDRYEQAWSRLEDFNRRFPVDMQKSILQMAIQGKLVEQRPEEGTGEELYQQIQQEKQRLIKAGTIKKEKPLPEITEDEIPFDIPEGWKWVRLNDISLMVGDIDHKMPPTVDSGGIPYISPLNFTKDGGIDYAGAKRISLGDYEILARKCKPSRNDIIFPRYGTIGVVRIVDTDEPFLVSYSCCTIKHIGNTFMDHCYVFSVLKSRLTQDEINKYINKTTQPNVGLQSIKLFLFPLPPLAEQKRIVAKLEEILPLCDRFNEDKRYERNDAGAITAEGRYI